MGNSSSPLRLASVLLFAVDLDGRSIGTHEFHVEGLSDTSAQIRSIATFDVRILGIRAYRYRHEANEQWTQGCLKTLSASTDDNGRKTQVSAERTDGRFRIIVDGNGREAEDCTRSFAYWQPRWLSAPSLLNPQTGKLDDAKLTTLPDENLTLLDGRSVPARHLRLDAGGLAIELWYGKNDEWLQLTSTTKEGKHLRYRRRDVPLHDAPAAPRQ